MNENICTRELLERNEKQNLSSMATLSSETKGRDRYEEKCPLRTDFQRDRDRIIHCKSFRRMKHKTQVFLAPRGDHYRTRLTHTLEVSQIARTMARALFLNEDLTEAIALGHDLGHTPFGHAGEKVLNDICPGGFKHNEQSVRVVEVLEKDGKGLNLTYEVRDGMRCHTTANTPSTPEGQLVRLADKIAYINHDIDDAVRAGIMQNEDIPRIFTERFGNTLSERINSMVTNVFENSSEEIGMDGETYTLFYEFREYLFANIYRNPVCKSEEKKAQDLLKYLYEYYSVHTKELPAEYVEILERDGAPRAVCDYISGMTDQFAVAKFSELSIPKFWTAT